MCCDCFTETMCFKIMIQLCFHAIKIEENKKLPNNLIVDLLLNINMYRNFQSS